MHSISSFVFSLIKTHDAADQIFCLRTAELLDEHIAGSHGTSPYIRAVFYLTEPFRNLSFGTPADVQASVSCGMTLLRLWKRTVSISKGRLRSGKGAIENPKQRGNFVTYGCELTAEILYSTATLYNLLPLHFKDTGVPWASPHFSGTRTTEKIIGELQGKTVQFQFLNAQPTFCDMLNSASTVQFNQQTEKKLASKGVKIVPTTNRKRSIYQFQKHYDDVQCEYNYPGTYEVFQEEQRAAHKKGVRLAQDIFVKYAPEGAIDALKSNNFLEKPYVFSFDGNMNVIDGSGLPPGYADRFCRDWIFDMSDETSIEQKLSDDEVNNNEFVGSTDGVTSDVDDIVDEDGSDDDSSKSSNSAWYVSRLEGGQLRDIHIKKALKLLIPREFISKNGSQCHTSSKYLSGFEVIEKSHDIVLFCDIALKAQFQHKEAYKVGRIIALRSDQGKDLVITSSKSKTVKIRCLIYQKSSGYYRAPVDMGITEWKSVSCVLKVLSLKFVEDKGLQLNLKDEDCLRQMSMCPSEDLEAASVDTELESDSSAENIQIPLSDESDESIMKLTPFWIEDLIKILIWCNTEFVLKAMEVRMICGSQRILSTALLTFSQYHHLVENVKGGLYHILPIKTFHHETQQSKQISGKNKDFARFQETKAKKVCSKG